MLFREHTPIETYRLGRQSVFVKRDDLYGVAPGPPLAKLRGLRVVLDQAQRRGVRLVGCWDTRISMLGLGLAACCRGLPRMRCLVSYPMGKGDATPAPALLARELGAELLPVRAARMNICFAEARRQVEARGGWMLPFGLECPEAVEAVAREAARLDPAFFEDGTIVLSCGSGVTLAGLLRGLRAQPRRIVGVSSGRSPKNILRCLRRYLPELPAFLDLREAAVPYRLAIDYPCQFPTNAYYDLKAWKYLAENLPQLAAPVLFWNIGASMPGAAGQQA
jgi:1-aminocyclopropane-1-carboxylate deaminase/D-cysteine desulfhydrase-like pyridoxal-dependent ACC family enzyme